MFMKYRNKIRYHKIRCIYIKVLPCLLACNNSLSARIYYRVPPPAPCEPKFSNSENCCGSENAMQPKIFQDMKGHRGNFR